MNILNGLGITLIAALITALIAVSVAYPVMLVWNAVIPSIFGLPTITFTQALYLSMLTSILFKAASSSSK